MADVRQIGLDEVVRHFEELEDPRSEVNLRHPLQSVIVIALLAVLAGAGGPTAIARWAVLKQEFLVQVLDLPHGIPSKDGSSVFKCEAEGFLTIWPGCLPGLSSPVRAPGDLRGRHPDQYPRPRQDRHRDQRDYRGGFAPRRRDHRV